MTYSNLLEVKLCSRSRKLRYRGCDAVEDLEKEVLVIKKRDSIKKMFMLDNVEYYRVEVRKIY